MEILIFNRFENYDYIKAVIPINDDDFIAMQKQSNYIPFISE